MSLIDRSFIGEGIVYGRVYQSQDALLPFGNCDAFNLRFATDRKTLANFMGGGGNRNVRERPTDVTGAIGMYDLTPTNIARVTRSTIKHIAAGTVTDPAECARIAAAGGQLVVTPHADPEVVRAAKSAGMFAVPGFFTPGEAFALLKAGADGLKLFPAEAASPAVVKAMLAVLPKGTPVLPVGGIDAGNMTAWRAAGAAGFGIGSSIYKPGDSAAIVSGKARVLMAALTPT